MHTKLLVLSIVRIRNQQRPLTLREILLQTDDTSISLSFLSQPGVEQEEVIPRLIILLVVGILGGQSHQCFLAQNQIIQFVFKDDTSVKQAILDESVAGRQLFFSKGNLCQIVFPLMWVAGC